jgi:hypothetical protein
MKVSVKDGGYMPEKKEASKSQKTHSKSIQPRRIQTAEGWKRMQLRKRKSSNKSK